MDIDDVINEGYRKESFNSRDSFQVMDDDLDKGYSARFTYNPNSSYALQTKKEIMQEIKPRL